MKLKSFHRVLFFLVFVGCGLQASPSLAQVETQNKNVTLNFVLPSMYPYSWVGPGGEHRGVFVDVVQGLFEETHINIKIRVLSHSRFRRDVNNEQRDVSVASTFVEPGSDSVILGPVFCSNISILPLLGTGINSMEDLEGKTVSVVTGSRSTNILQENSEIKVVEVPNSFDNFRMLALERVEAIKASGITISRLFKGFSDVQNITAEDMENFGEPFPIAPFRVNLTIDKNSLGAEDLALLKSKMTQYLASDKYRNILNNYGKTEDLVCKE